MIIAEITERIINRTLKESIKLVSIDASINKADVKIVKLITKATS